MRIAAHLILTIVTALALPAVAHAQAPAATPAKADWTRTYGATVAGGMTIGNPKAPMLLTEYASYTCSHCQDFHLNGKPKLMPYIASGKLRYEFRSFLRNSVDTAVTMVTMCQTPARFWSSTDLMFKDTTTWLKGFMDMDQDATKSLEGKPLIQQVSGIATLGGLPEYLRKKGMPAANTNRCLANSAMLTKLQASQKVAFEKYNIQGTPTFLLNGVVLDGVASWDSLEPRLKAGK
jgi:hypothetical protein